MLWWSDCPEKCVFINRYNLFHHFCFDISEFSREKDRVENHVMFIKQRRKEEMAAQRSADSYGEWVDKGELADMKEANGKCRCC